MAKLYFYYSAMNAGKSTILLQSSYNYRERGMNTLILQPEIDNRFGAGTVASRIGISAEARTFHLNENLFHIVEHELEKRPLHCVLVDEAQFLTQLQAKQLSDVCDTLNIPVLAYGLRTDFQGNLFEGSQQLLAWADTMVEVKTICHCGRKATMVLRIGEDGSAIKEGNQVQIGGNDRYLGLSTTFQARLVRIAKRSVTIDRRLTLFSGNTVHEAIRLAESRRRLFFFFNGD